MLEMTRLSMHDATIQLPPDDMTRKNSPKCS